jgi:hypothetical protein
MQKVSKTPISANKLGIVKHACGPSYWGSIDRKMWVPG